MIDNPITPTDTETGTGTTFTVTNTRDSGTGSLRQAILDANANPGKDTIAFNIGGGGVQRIEPVSPLPPIADPAIVDGTTQPGFTTSPIIELNGSVAGENASGLLITAGNSTVKGLVINQFSQYGMRLQNLGNNQIRGNYLGTDISGTLALGNGRDGLRIESPNNAIGGTTPEARNLISGNVEYGVFIRSTDEIEATGNQVIGNYIGTDVTGTQALSNTRDGLYILEASDNIIGGTTAAAGNLISGNDRGGVRISGIGAIGNEVLGNYIGTDVSGTLALGNANYGILVETSNNTIGGRTEGSRNLISGNGEYGVFIRDTEETEATGNEVIGNYIGTDVTGTFAVNNLRDGVYILDAANNIIGGVGTAAGNLLSGNRNGVRILGSSASGNEVLGNFIGTDANGTAAIANTSSGVRIEAVNNIIGGTIAGARNLISGNLEYGVQIRGTEEIDTTGNQVIGNYIGTDVTGTAAVGNTRDAVYIEAAAANTIGGTSLEARNLISGNNRGGVLIRGSNARSNQVLGNYIGTDVSGTTALGNTGSGVRIEAIDNRIGGPTPGAGNLISGNLEYGVYIRNTEENESRDNQVIGNYIGTDVTGTAAVANTRDGVYIEEGANNTIGGTSQEARNLISGNNRGGVLIRGSGARSNEVLGNYIGTDVSGSLDVGNSNYGVRVEAVNNVIGGLTPEARNIISGNGDYGVFILSREEIDATLNRVLGNYIGTDVSGTIAVGNDLDGVYIQEAANNTIGGTSQEARNLISGNNRGGVLIRGSGARSNEVLGNYIGTDVSGTTALGNTGSGVRIEAIDNRIGGATPGAGNLISGNLEDGVYIRSTEENESRDNQVIGNYIGTDVTGTAAVGNIRDGARIEASNNIIGGTTLAAGNILAFNGEDGVFVRSGTDNAILSNSIFSNADLAIDLNPGGVTENDVGDSDTGANNLQNFPVLTSVSLGEDDSSTIIAGTLNSTPNSTLTIQFFTNTASDPSGNGEGQTWLGATTVTTDASGNANFTETFEIVISPAQFVTATATDSNNNTSEFSPGRTIASMGNRIIGTPEDDILIGTAGDDAIFARAANDLVNGNLGDDSIAGGPDNDSLTGSIGNDLMFGGEGDDLLDGSAGDDTLIGGLGLDLLVGREGSDLFVLRTSTAVADKLQADVLLSFDPGVDAIGLTAGLTASDLILERMGTNTVISIAQSNLVLGVVSVVLPDQLAGSFVPFDFDLSDE